MVQINLGTAPNDGTGDDARTAGGKLNATGLRKNNYAATADPGAGDDTADGYEVGSAWLNTVTGDLFYAASVTLGAAVWQLHLTAGGSGDIPAKAMMAAADHILILDSAAGDAAKKTPATEFRKETIIVALSDETTALTAGTAKRSFRMPFAMTLTSVRSMVNTAPTGATLIVDINEGDTPVSILSTKLSIDISEKTSTTAAVPAVISDTNLADDALITFDIDQIGSTIAGAGLKVALIGYRT